MEILESNPENTRKQPNPMKRPNDPDNEMKTLDKRPKLDDNLTSGHQMSDKEACWSIKIIKCNICQHFARHPDAPNPLVIGNVPKFVRPCVTVKRECSHNCTHMIKKIANLLIINCNELKHLYSQKFLNDLKLDIAEELNDDPDKFLKCSWENCSKNCSHMISAQVIERYFLVNKA